MSRKKTYHEYRQDPKVRFPAVAYVLDRKAVYITFSLVALLALGFTIKIGWDSYSRSIQEPEVVTPYLDLESVSSTGRTWAAELAAQNPADIAEWAISENTKPQTVIDSKICANIADLSTSLLSTHVASGKGVQTRIQVYGAGQAFKQFESYRAALDVCFNGVSAEKVSETTVARFPGGFIMTSGDAIIGVSTTEDLVDPLMNFYVTKMEETLKNSKCLSLSVVTADANRSFFYDRETYTGLEEKKPLETQVDIAALPTPTEIVLNEVENPDAVTPEAPLPSNFPQLPKTTANKPSIPTPVPNETAFAGDAAYKIADSQGPGCGWAWSAQSAPIYSEDELEAAKNASIRSTQEMLNANAANYVGNKIKWALQMAEIAPTADRWNTFVNQTNTVHEKWSWLEMQRAELEPFWFDYVAQHEYWSTFDARKAAAKTQFEEELKRCETDQKALEDWEEEWGDEYREQNKPKPSPSASPEPTRSAKPTATPSPSPTIKIPEKPAGCDTPPERPAIIDTEKPAEPQPPVVPEGVTVPNSWPNPKKS